MLHKICISNTLRTQNLTWTISMTHDFPISLCLALTRPAHRQQNKIAIQLWLTNWSTKEQIHYLTEPLNTLNSKSLKFALWISLLVGLTINVFAPLHKEILTSIHLRYIQLYNSTSILDLLFNITCMKSDTLVHWNIFYSHGLLWLVQIINFPIILQNRLNYTLQNASILQNSIAMFFNYLYILLLKKKLFQIRIV